MSDEPTKKPTTKFGSIQQQWDTIGGAKGDTTMAQDTLTQKRQNSITSKQQDIQEMKRQTVYMPQHLAIWLKAHAALNGEDISGIITHLVEDYKNKEEGK